MAAAVGSLNTEHTRQVLDFDTNVLYADPGYLLFVRDGLLMAQPFDATRLEVEGEAIQIAGNVNRDGVGFGHFSASSNGVLAYKSEIFYIDLAGALMSVELTAALEPSLPKKLFDTHLDFREWHEYAVSFDGQKFLVNNATQSGVPPINVVVNWTARAER
jgi:hypothetical protein